MGKTAQKQSRARLAALAAEQAQEIAGLRAQLDRTQAQLAAAQAQLDDRRIACEQAGTMAQAAMTLNGVFAAADEAAAQYLENLRLFTERQHRICAGIEQETRDKAEAMLRETQERCRAREREADAYWEKLSSKLEQFCAQHKELRELMESYRQSNADD